MHSRYIRHFTDSAVGGHPVKIELQVCRFRCRGGACPQATFAKWVGGLTFRYGRRIAGLQATLERLAVMLVSRAVDACRSVTASPAVRPSAARLRPVQNPSGTPASPWAACSGFARKAVTVADHHAVAVVRLPLPGRSSLC